MYGSEQYGTVKYGEELVEQSEIDFYKPELSAYLPSFIAKTKIISSVNDSIENELGLLNYSIRDIVKQCFIDTATWGLILWENQFGITTDLNKSYEERREIIKAKRRGAGTITVKMIQNTAIAFSGGDVNVIEHPESYSFTIQFVGVRGIPKNMESFKQMIDSIKPAHLAYDFKYTYTVWGFLTQSNLTWNNAKTWKDLKVYE